MGPSSPRCKPRARLCPDKRLAIILLVVPVALFSGFEMPSLVIKDFPADLHRELKVASERHHRSMVQEALVALKFGLAAEPMRPEDALASLPAPYRPKRPLTNAEWTRMKRLGLS